MRSTEWKQGKPHPLHHGPHLELLLIDGTVRSTTWFGNDGLGTTPAVLVFTDVGTSAQGAICDESKIRAWRVKADVKGPYDRAMEHVNNAQIAQQEERRISELTVREFRQLMQECFEKDRAYQANQLAMQRAANPEQGNLSPQFFMKMWKFCG